MKDSLLGDHQGRGRDLGPSLPHFNDQRRDFDIVTAAKPKGIRFFRLNKIGFKTIHHVGLPGERLH